MMRRLLIFMFLLSFNITYGQNLITHKEYYDVFKTRIKIEYGTLPDGKMHGSYKFYSYEGVLQCLDTYENGDLKNSKVLFLDGSVQYETNWSKDKHNQKIRQGVIKGYKFHNGQRFLYVDAFAEDDEFVKFKIYSEPNKLFREYVKKLNGEEYKEYENGKVKYHLVLRDGILTMTAPNGKVENNIIKSFSGILTYNTEVSTVDNGRIKMIEQNDKIYTEGVFLPLPVEQKFHFSIDKEILFSKTFGISLPKDAYISVRIRSDELGKNYNKLFELFVLSIDKLDGKYLKKENDKIIKEGEYKNGIPIWYVHYDLNGKLISECQNGEETFYDPKTGGKVSTARYEDGNRIRTGYYEHGQKRWESKETLSDKPTVLSVNEFYQNGDLKKQSYTVDSIKVGNRMYYNVSRSEEFNETGAFVRELIEVLSTQPEFVSRGNSYEMVNKRITIKDISYVNNRKSEETEVYYDGRLYGRNFRELSVTTKYNNDNSKYSVQYTSNDTPAINDLIVYDKDGTVISNKSIVSEYEKIQAECNKQETANLWKHNELKRKLEDFDFNLIEEEKESGKKQSRFRNFLNEVASSSSSSTSTTGTYLTGADIFKQQKEQEEAKARAAQKERDRITKPIRLSLISVYKEFTSKDSLYVKMAAVCDLKIKDADDDNRKDKLDAISAKKNHVFSRHNDMLNFILLLDKYSYLLNNPQNPIVPRLEDAKLDDVYDILGVEIKSHPHLN